MTSSNEFSSSPDVIGYLVLNEDGQIMNVSLLEKRAKLVFYQLPLTWVD